MADEFDCKELLQLADSFVKSTRKKHFSEVYNIVRTLGEGSEGKVCSCVETSTGKRFAVKIIRKISDSRRKDVSAQVKKEVAIQLLLQRHINTVQLHEVLEDSYYIYMIMELCTVGELYSILAKNGCLTERSAAMVMRQLLCFLAYAHKLNVVHRDLKPENLFFQKQDGETLLKIGDFGLSNVCTEQQSKLRDRVGTIYYIAPEVLNTAVSYGSSADIWSAGVTLYVILSGKPPFDGDDDDAIVRNIQEGSLEFSGNTWQSMSAELKDLLTKMLDKSPCHRPSALELLHHPWFSLHGQRVDFDELAATLNDAEQTSPIYSHSHPKAMHQYRKDALEAKQALQKALSLEHPPHHPKAPKRRAGWAAALLGKGGPKEPPRRALNVVQAPDPKAISHPPATRSGLNQKSRSSSNPQSSLAQKSRQRSAQQKLPPSSQPPAAPERKASAECQAATPDSPSATCVDLQSAFANAMRLHCSPPDAVAAAAASPPTAIGTATISSISSGSSSDEPHPVPLPHHTKLDSAAKRARGGSPAALRVKAKLGNPSAVQRIASDVIKYASGKLAVMEEGEMVRQLHMRDRVKQGMEGGYGGGSAAQVLQQVKKLDGMEEGLHKQVERLQQKQQQRQQQRRWISGRMRLVVKKRNGSAVVLVVAASSAMGSGKIRSKQTAGSRCTFRELLQRVAALFRPREGAPKNSGTPSSAEKLGRS